MNKGKVTLIAFSLILLIVFNVIAFVAPFIRVGSYWVGYSFTMVAIVLSFAATGYAFHGNSLRSKFYGLPMSSLLWTYLLLQLILSFVFMGVSTIPVFVALIACVVLLAVFFIGFVAQDASADYVEKYDRKVKAKTFYISALQAEVELMEEKATDAALKKALYDLYEDIRYSDPMSSPDLAMLESKIEGKVAELGVLVDTGDAESAGTLCGELRLLLSERAKSASF